jgi:hypothetical protein
LAERSARSQQFALPYDWKKVVDQWDALLRSVASQRRSMMRTPPATTPLASVLPRVAREFDGVSIKVNLAQRQYGRLESAIRSDTQGHLSDVRIPAIQQNCQVAGLRVVRSPAYLGVASDDEPIFAELKRIFPMLGGWSIGAAYGIEADPSLTRVQFHDGTEVRYELAQSILVLNVSGEFPEATLVDAGLYGVPCIGTGASAVQRALWPELIADSPRLAEDLARELLTNAARLRRIASRAETACRNLFAPDEEESAACLRRLHQSRSEFSLAGIKN